MARAYKRTHPDAHLHVHRFDVFLSDGPVSLSLPLLPWQAAFVALLDGKYREGRMADIPCEDAAEVLERVVRMPDADLAQYGTHLQGSL